MLCRRHLTTLLFAVQPTTNFFVQYYRELEVRTGYWAADEEIGQEGFVQSISDIVWVHDEAADAWVARHFQGGRRLTQ